MDHLHVIRRRYVLAIIATVAFASPAQAQSDLDRAYRIIAGKQLVDLTHSFSPDTPVWSGFGQAKMTPAADPKTHEPYTIAKEGFRATLYEMVGQYGTHVDPPALLLEDWISRRRSKLPLILSAWWASMSG